MINPLKKILNEFRDKRIIVWGDLILDEYIFTTTGRISREAPVLVTEFESNEFKLGGAGNVVMNLESMGANPIPVGFIGTNSDGRILKEILGEKIITTDYLVELENYKTPKKSRILSGGVNTKKQQVLRIDTLNKGEIKKEAFQKIENILVKLLTNIDFLIISDYIYKSVNQETFKIIREKFPYKTIIIDSRNHLAEFEKVSIATPNEPEIKKLFPRKDFFSERDFLDAGEELLNRLNAEGVILKRGNKGMIVFEKANTPRKIEIHGSPEIVDETGAGDTVISVLSLALLSGADFFSSAQLANIAAGIVVMKEGTYPISIRELEDELK